MKKLFFKCLTKFVFVGIMLFESLYAIAGAGFWDDNSATIYYTQNEENKEYSIKKNGQEDLNIGSINVFKINSFQARTWRDGGNICQSNFKLHYSIHKATESASNWKETEHASWLKDDNKDQYWQLDNINLNVMEGLNSGDYVFEFYLMTTGKKNGNGCDDTFILNNNGSNYKINFSPSVGVYLTLSANAMKAGDTNPITLKAQAVGISGTTYKFEYKSFDADEWSTLAIQSSPEYVLSGTKLPTKSTSYRVTYGGTTSSEVKLSVLIDCAEGGSAKNILKYDFGTLASLSGDNSRTSSADMAKDYTYKPWAKKINDGHYAVVSTPYHCGCGDGGVDEDVTVCEAVQSPNMWFRDIKDHTLGDKGTEGNYGAMLMINFSDSKSKIAYEHILTTQEKAAFVKGSTLSFSAYFASAAKESSTEPINMKLKIDYKAVGSEEWVTKAELNNNVVYSDNWKYGNTSIDIDDPAGDYRVVIENNGKAGMGNDALIDDISLDLCVPTFPVEFYDVEKDSTYTEHTFLKMDEKQVIRIPKQDYGHGDANCVFLLSVDPSKAIGEAGRFKVIDEMLKTTYKGSDYYYIKRSANELLGGKTGSGKLQAFVTLPDNCTDPVKLADIKAKIEDGTIKPLDSSDYMFSTNLLSYDISCNDEIRLVLDKETPVCEAAGKKEMDMPIVKVYFGYISTFAYFSAVEDGTITLKESSKIGQAALNNGYITYSLNSDLLKDIIIRTPGQHTFTFTITEYANAQSTEKLCEKSASFTLEVVNMPNGTLEQSITKCDGVTKPVAVTANYAETYQWQVNTSIVASDWQDIQGATTANYTIPANATDGSQYQVVLGNQYCASQTSSVMNLTVETCDKVVLTMEPATQSICKGEEATFNLSVKNLGTVAANVNISEEAAALSGFDFVSATPSKGTFASGVWAITGLAKDETATMTVKYKANTSAEGIEKFYVSKLGDDTWGSYDLQTDDAMKASSEVKSKEISSTPEVIDYNECQQTGNKALADLVTSDKTALQWFSNRELTEPVIPAEFDMNVPVQGKSYFVVNTEDGKCVSEKAVASVTVRKAPVTPITKNFNECTTSKTLDLKTLVTNYDAQNTYTYYYNDVPLNDPVVNLESGATKSYSVMATLNDCESEKVDMTVSVKSPVKSVTLHEADGGEYDLSGVPTVQRSIGMTTNKVLTIDPADAQHYSLKWYIGDNEFDGEFPRTPYTDQIYKAVLVDECENVHIAQAGTQVIWPTIFMPYQDGPNDDFVVDVEGGVELYVFDRSGNMVAHTYNGWDGYANQNGKSNIVMPDVYYYKAILPDGSTKKGTVEVFKK